MDVEFAETSYTVRENSGSVSVCINISGAVLERNVTVLLSTMDDEATCELSLLENWQSCVQRIDNDGGAILVPVDSNIILS